MTGERGLCAYAFTRGQEWARVRFPVGVEPRLVTADGIGLVVAEVDTAVYADLDDDRLAALAREHDAIVKAVFEREPVLPLRFGTIVGDDSAALKLLADQRSEVSDWLERVAGQREWGVRVEYETPVKPADVALTGLSGADYLRQRRQNRTDGQRTRDHQRDLARALHTALARFATDCVHRSRGALDAAYLVPQGEEGPFRAEAARLCEEIRRQGGFVHATGPWPPYSFTRIELAVQR